MQWSQTPRRSKMLFLGFGVLALTLVLAAVISTDDEPQLGADLPSGSSETLVAGEGEFVNLLVKVTDQTGKAQAAFVDTFIDSNANCSVDESEEASGFVGETKADGTAALSIPDNQYYIVRALAKEGSSEGTAFLAVNATGEECMKEVKAPNEEPVVIPLKSS